MRNRGFCEAWVLQVSAFNAASAAHTGRDTDSRLGEERVDEDPNGTAAGGVNPPIRLSASPPSCLVHYQIATSEPLLDGRCAAPVDGHFPFPFFLVIVRVAV